MDDDKMAKGFLSPLRYPGGKSWLLPEVEQWMKGLHNKPKMLVEPFAGGAAVSFHMLSRDLVDRVLLIERDPQVAAIWKAILCGDHAALKERIERFEVTHENIKLLESKRHKSTVDVAFQALVRNRLSRGGVISASGGMLKNGENGRGLTSRWYPKTLIERIDAVAALADKVTFLEADALDVLPGIIDIPHYAIFADPPYAISPKDPGQRLYNHYDVDHLVLFRLMARSRGPWMMTYNETQVVKSLISSFGFRRKAVRMKNSHHKTKRELVITKK